ncbi:hypothetical protein CAP36_14985 [Chitinophagaceae bacterium IBVUCB2]|nr:hypothetical protein CAP36_14985 [Chitinophagaceae bacterium IBVUCB2]
MDCWCSRSATLYFSLDWTVLFRTEIIVMVTLNDKSILRICTMQAFLNLFKKKSLLNQHFAD